MKVEWEGKSLPENDLWKLFSDHPDKGSDTIQFYSQIKPLLAKMKLTDETRFYHLYTHSVVDEPPAGARLRATVTQRNLLRVANLMTGRVSSVSGIASPETAIQYLGPISKS